MAQLKDLIVNGASRLIGKLYANDVQITSITAPISAGSTTYGLGTEGQALKTNGTSVYWGDTSSFGIATNTTAGVVKPWFTRTSASTGPTTGNDSTAITVNALTSSSGRYYAVEADSVGRLFVNVPWVGGTNGVTEETDPTVPAWAKASSKPSYTASEVGAVPASMTSTGVALANGDRLLFSDNSNSGKVERTSITIGTGTTTYLRNDGSWGTPAGGQVVQTAKSDNVEYKVLATQTASPTSGNAAEAIYASGITINPSTNTLSASKVKGSLIGSYQPINGSTSFAIDANGIYDEDYDNYIIDVSTSSTPELNIAKINGVTVGSSPKFTDTTYTFNTTAQTNKIQYKLNNTGSWIDIPINVSAQGGGGGTVTSVQVAATSPVVSSDATAQSGSLSTTISLADGYGDTKNPYGSKTKRYVLAAPTGANGVPSFRALDAVDIPSLPASKINSGTLGATLGGTGISSYTAGDILYASNSMALSKLGANTTTTKQFLCSVATTPGTGTAPTWSTIYSQDVTLSPNPLPEADTDRPIIIKRDSELKIQTSSNTTINPVKGQLKMTGTAPCITLTSTTDTYVKVNNSTYGSLNVQLDMSGAGNHGIWSTGYYTSDGLQSDPKWMIYRKASDGKIYINDPNINGNLYVNSDNSTSRNIVLTNTNKSVSSGTPTYPNPEFWITQQPSGTQGLWSSGYYGSDANSYVEASAYILYRNSSNNLILGNSTNINNINLNCSGQVNVNSQPYRTIYIGTSATAPSGMANGDIYLQYTN